MTPRRRALGAAGEAVAGVWYRRAGYEVLETNWRSGRCEIDLIASRGSTLVFCEVKTRSSDRFGTGAEAVDGRKQATIRRVAMAYLAALRDRGVRASWDLRFDVAVVTPGSHGLAVEVIEAAF